MQTEYYCDARRVVFLKRVVEPVYDDIAYLYGIYNEEQVQVAKFIITKEYPTRYDVLLAAKDAEHALKERFRVNNPLKAEKA